MRAPRPLVALTQEVRFASVEQAVGERIVDEQLAELREAQQVHDTFTELSIAEAGPREILEAVQRLAGTAVVLESEQHQVLDYQTGSENVAGFVTNCAARSEASGWTDARRGMKPTPGWSTRVGKRDRDWGRLVVQTSTAPSARLVATIERAAAAIALHRLHDRQSDGNQLILIYRR